MSEEVGPGEATIKHKFKKISNGRPVRLGDGRVYTVLDTRVTLRDGVTIFTHVVDEADTSVPHHEEVKELEGWM